MEPGFECGVRSVDDGGEFLLCPGDSLIGFAQLLVLLRGGEIESGRGDGAGEIGIEAGLVDIREIGTQLVVFLGGYWIVFVIVAAGAFHGESEEGGAEGVEAIGDILDTEFLRDAAAFHLLGVEAIKSCGKNLVAGGIGKQIAGDLPGGELIIGEVVAEGS